MENNADPVQMALSKPSDLDLHCIPRIYLGSAGKGFKNSWLRVKDSWQDLSEECVKEKYFSYFSTKTYVVGAQKNRLIASH